MATIYVVLSVCGTENNVKGSYRVFTSPKHVIYHVIQPNLHNYSYILTLLIYLCVAMLCMLELAR